MKKPCRILACVMAIVSFATPAGAVLPSAVIERAKRATALVEITVNNEHGFGSAFCIDSSGLFVTNAHVAASKKGEKIRLVLNPGEKTERIVQARILRSDAELDLAILQSDVSLPETTPVVELGSVDDLTETAEVTAFGYPFGNMLALEKNSFPSVSVNIGHITSLRKKAGELEMIQVDAMLNPGNSGGPVLDDNGRVIGVVRAGVPGTGIAFAIPVSQVQKFTSKPLIVLSPTTFPYDKRDQEQSLSVKVISFGKQPATRCAVELTLTGDNALPRTLTGHVSAGSCNFTFIPVPGGAVKAPQVTAKFSDGSITGRVKDHPIYIGDQKVDLSGVRAIDFSVAEKTLKASATLLDGSSISGALKGLENVQVILGGELTVSMDMSKARHIEVTTSESGPSSLMYSVSIKSPLGTSIGELTGNIILSGAPATASPAGVMAPTIAEADAGPPVARNPIEARRIAMDAPGTVLSPLVGGNGGGLSTEIRRPYGPPVGVRYAIGQWAGKSIVRDIEFVWSRKDVATPDKPGLLFAREGYVIGGVVADGKDLVNALRIIFIRQQGAALDPKDTYQSDWLGTPWLGQSHQLAGHGEVIVGLVLHKGLNCDGLGLIMLP